MSWTMVIQKEVGDSQMSKYNVTAFQEGNPSAISTEFNISRTEIINDFQKLLPAISGIRFRSLKLESCDSDYLIKSIKDRIRLSFSDDFRAVIDSADTLHFITDDVKVPWELTGLEDNLKQRCSFGISQLARGDLQAQKLKNLTHSIYYLL